MVVLVQDDFFLKKKTLKFGTDSFHTIDLGALEMNCEA